MNLFKSVMACDHLPMDLYMLEVASAEREALQSFSANNANPKDKGKTETTWTTTQLELSLRLGQVHSAGKSPPEKHPFHSPVGVFPCWVRSNCLPGSAPLIGSRHWGEPWSGEMPNMQENNQRQKANQRLMSLGGWVHLQCTSLEESNDWTCHFTCGNCGWCLKQTQSKNKPNEQATEKRKAQAKTEELS